MTKILILAAGAFALSAAVATAQTVTTEKEYGNYSAPVAGATPRARENPSPGTTVLRERERVTVTPAPAERRTTVIEQGGSVDAEVTTRGRVPD